MIGIVSHRRNVVLLHTGAAMLGLLAPGVAWAGEPPAAAAEQTGRAEADPGRDIIVTARRREESAQDIPVTLSVVSGAEIEQSRALTINQIQQLVPSLQVIAGNPRNSNVNIRGLGANSSIAVDGLEYGVGFYVDGVYFARPGQAQFELADLQRVEVLRGPQGTLFGKNTTAGAINITTRLPSFDPELTADIEGGNYGAHRVRISGSAPLVADKVAVRLSLTDTHRDGFLKNLYDGRRAQDFDNFTARGQLLVKPAENVTVRLIGDYAKQKQHFTLNIADGYFSSYANGATIPNNIFDRAARTGYTLLPPDAFRREGNSDAPFRANMESYGASGEINWDLGRATLTSITAYRWWDWYPQNDVDGTALSINTKGQLIDRQRQFSQELRVASTGTNTVDYVAGLYYFWQIVRGYGEIAYGPDFAAWNLNPATTPAGTIALTNLALSGFEADYFSNPETRSYAGFGQVDWHVTSALTLTGGLRYTHEDKNGRFDQFWVAGVDVATLPPAQAAGVTAVRNSVNRAFSFSAKTKADAVSGLASISYKVTPDALLYGNYSRGNKSGGLNLTAGGALQPVVGDEKVDNFEIGFKSQLLDRRLTVNGAAFNTVIRDYQTTISEQVAGTTATTQYIANIPKVRSRGFEADVTFAPIRRLQLTASGAYTDATYRTYVNAPQAPERTNQGAIQDLSGKHLTNVPKFSYSLAADANQPLGGGTTELYGHADYFHRSSVQSTSQNSIYGVVPAYGLLNARVGLRREDERWDISAWARNLTDKNYYISKGVQNFGLITGTLGEPRTYGITLRTSL